MRVFGAVLVFKTKWGAGFAYLGRTFAAGDRRRNVPRCKAHAGMTVGPHPRHRPQSSESGRSRVRGHAPFRGVLYVSSASALRRKSDSTMSFWRSASAGSFAAASCKRCSSASLAALAGWHADWVLTPESWHSEPLK